MKLLLIGICDPGYLMPVKKGFIIALFLACLIPSLQGCATREIVKGATLSRYTSFEVLPVADETGGAYDFDVAAELTEKILSVLRQEGFNVGGASGNILMIKSSLISYDSLAGGTASCSVRSILIDERTDKIVDEIVVTSSVSAGGLSQMGLEASRAILEITAHDIVIQIERRMRTKK